MFKHFKILIYVIIILIIIFLYWFLPKYSFVNKNPGYCVRLAGNFYYCGNEAGLDKLFGK